MPSYSCSWYKDAIIDSIPFDSIDSMIDYFDWLMIDWLIHSFIHSITLNCRELRYWNRYNRTVWNLAIMKSYVSGCRIEIQTWAISRLSLLQYVRRPIMLIHDSRWWLVCFCQQQSRSQTSASLYGRIQYRSIILVIIATYCYCYCYWLTRVTVNRADHQQQR